MNTAQLPQIFSKQLQSGEILFKNPLKRATLVKRINRFVATIELENGEILEAHCPTTGSVGGWDLSGLQCLVSGPHSSSRRTQYTIEALIVPLPDGSSTTLGINQSAANRYIEASLLLGDLEEIVGPIAELKREKKLGQARIDFNVDGEEFIEVKTPLKTINIDTLVPVKNLKQSSKFYPASTERLLKHIRNLTRALEEGQKAILLTCFIYDSPKFNPPKSTHYENIEKALEKAKNKGLESWQVNYKISEKSILLRKVEKLSLGS